MRHNGSLLLELSSFSPPSVRSWCRALFLQHRYMVYPASILLDSLRTFVKSRVQSLFRTLNAPSCPFSAPVQELQSLHRLIFLLATQHFGRVEMYCAFPIIKLMCIVDTDLAIRMLAMSQQKWRRRKPQRTASIVGLCLILFRG